MTRIRVTERCCWSERIGCTGTIVVPTPEQANVYPFASLGKREVVVKLDIDPLDPLGRNELWSCVLTRDMCEYVPTDADLGLS